MNNMNPNQPQNTDPNALNIELSEAIAEGEYANLAMIAHSSSEFVVDFIRLLPGLPKAKVKARVILTPSTPSACWRRWRRIFSASNRAMGR